MFFNGIQSVFAQTDTSSTSTSSQTAYVPMGLFVLWRICNSQKHKAIGGWLLFYYITLFLGSLFTLSSIATFAVTLNIANRNGAIMQYVLYIISAIPVIILLIMELIFASMLLSNWIAKDAKKSRNLKIYKALKITLATSLAFGFIALIIDSLFFPGNIILDIFPIIGAAF
jgi:hypothetical protein